MNRQNRTIIHRVFPPLEHSIWFQNDPDVFFDSYRPSKHSWMTYLSLSTIQAYVLYYVPLTLLLMPSSSSLEWAAYWCIILIIFRLVIVLYTLPNTYKSSASSKFFYFIILISVACQSCSSQPFVCLGNTVSCSQRQPHCCGSSLSSDSCPPIGAG